MYSAYVINDVCEELGKAISKFPQWPSDMINAFCIVCEEYGELAKSILQFVYEKDKGISERNIREEAIQTCAMLIRFINHLDANLYKTEIRYF